MPPAAPMTETLKAFAPFAEELETARTCANRHRESMRQSNRGESDRRDTTSESVMGANDPTDLELERRT